MSLPNRASLPLRSLTLAASALALPLSLAACGSGDDNEAELAELDDNLTGANADPAMNDALEDAILVDPDLTDRANTNAGRTTNGPVDGMVPPERGTDGSRYALAQLDGRMLSAPAPRKMTSDDECSDCGGVESADGMTLGAKADAQAGACTQKLDYDMGWSRRMPDAFPVYPRANVQEAAGVEGGRCDLRVVSFTTATPMKKVVDYYYTRAKRDGYSAEYLLRGGEHVLGGVRDADDGAYFITFARKSGGRTAVDIVASNGG